MSTLDQTKKKMQGAVDHYKEDIKGLRTNRASPSFLDSVTVEAYEGTFLRLKDIATITAPEPRQLLISPHDRLTIGPITKAIEKSNLGVQAIAEGNTIRIPFPSLDESVRKEIVKKAKQLAEAAKVTIREIRRKGNEQIRKEKTDAVITEDVLKKTEKSIQEFTDQFCKEIDQLFVNKEKEILTI